MGRRERAAGPEPTLPCHSGGGPPGAREGLGRADAEELVATALALAAARDGSSGGLLRLVTMSAAGCERRLIPGDQVRRPARSPRALTNLAAPGERPMWHMGPRRTAACPLPA